MANADVSIEVTAGKADLRYSRADSDVWILIAAMIAILGAVCWATGVRVDLTSNPILLGIAACYTLLTFFYVFVRKEPEIGDALVIFGQLLLVMILGLLLTYAVSATSIPYRDAEFQAADEWLGFNRAAYLKFLTAHPVLLSFVNVGYESIRLQFLVAPFALMFSGYTERCRAYLIAYGVSLTITSLVAGVLPAMNALTYVDLPLAGYGELSPHISGYFPTLEALRSGVMRHIPLYGFEGLISFPSFHTVSAVLFIWVFWPFRLLRPFAVALNGLMIAGTPGFGAHYFVDIIAGIAVAIVSIHIAYRIRSLATSPATVRSSPGSTTG